MFDAIVPGHVFFTVIIATSIILVLNILSFLHLKKVHDYILKVNPQNDTSYLPDIRQFVLGDSTLPDLLINALPQAFLLVNSNGVITRANKIAYKLFETRELKQEHIAQFVPKDKRVQHEEGMKEYLNNKNPQDLGLRNIDLLTKKGNIVKINMKFSVVGEDDERRIIILADKV